MKTGLIVGFGLGWLTGGGKWLLHLLYLLIILLLIHLGHHPLSINHVTCWGAPKQQTSMYNTYTADCRGAASSGCKYTELGESREALK